MVSKTTIMMVCDMCAAESPQNALKDGHEVLTHTISIDGKAFEVELCGKDFTRMLRPLAQLGEAGRVVKNQKNGRTRS